jgi:predicted chitinase
MVYSRKNISNESDRVILEQAEARELYRNWETSKNRDLIRARLERAERIYGTGARDRIRAFMQQMQNGTLL